MRKLIYISILLFGIVATAQSALYNSGNIRIHDNGNIGFHTNFINDTAFDQDEGLVGFYGNAPLTIQGSIPPTFYDLEIMAPGSLFLRSSVNILNHVNFIDGDIHSPLNDQTTYLNFLNDGFYSNESDDSKVSGFVAITNRSLFVFPVGDRSQLRPLTLDSQSIAPLSVCAYYFEDPSNPSSFSESYDTDEKVRDIGTVASKEFWVVQSDAVAVVTLPWNERSALGSIPNTTVEDIVIVGWSKSSNQWVVIGNTAQSGNLSQGFITSKPFVPSEFDAITFGTVPLPTDTFAVNNPTLGNYFISPNGDGANDFLVIEGMSESPNNSLRIFNRFGQKVFEKINYVDEFVGISNTGNINLNQEIGLPEGIYYYLVTLDDLGLEYQGFLFLDR